MNCMSKKVLHNKERMRREREEAVEKAYRESLSEEDLATYLKRKEESRKRAARVFAVASAIGATSKFRR